MFSRFIKIKPLYFRNFVSNAAEIVRPLILGIETSCDDTGAAIVDRTGRVFSECIRSQQNVHLRLVLENLFNLFII